MTLEDFSWRNRFDALDPTGRAKTMFARARISALGWCGEEGVPWPEAYSSPRGVLALVREAAVGLLRVGRSARGRQWLVLKGAFVGP